MFRPLPIISRCVESISSKVVIDPVEVDWSFSYSRASVSLEHVSVSQPATPAVWNGVQGCPWLSPIPKDWWLEDVCDLEVDLFWRVMGAVKAKGAASELVGEALRLYTQRWLPGVTEEHGMVDSTRGMRLAMNYAQETSTHRRMLETIVSLLPDEKSSCPCSFLLKLLKAATVLNASPSSKAELAGRIGLLLEEASLRDLLIPSLPFANESLYDVDVVIQMVEHYLLHNQSPPLSPHEGVMANPCERRRTRPAEINDLSDSQHSTAAIHGSKLKVAKLIDGYLAEVARDPNLTLAKFIQLAESIPDFTRPFHDGLYRAIDMYLKEHPNLSKGEKKKICRLMDCRKLSMDACMHAAQNERLPLRTVVQVLFFEQVRTAATGGFILNEMPGSIRALMGQESSDDISVSDVHTDHNVPSIPFAGQGRFALHHDFSTLKDDLADLKNRVAEAERKHASPTVTSPLQPSKPTDTKFGKAKKFFQKLISKKVSNSGSTKDSETLGSITPPQSKPSARLPRRHSMI